MVHLVAILFVSLLCHLSLQTSSSPAQQFSTNLGADSWFADVVLTKMSYYRALSHADPLMWNYTQASLAETDTTNCSLEYDIWNPDGQIIFRIGRQDNHDVDLVNNTYFAIDHWYDLRHFYHPTSDDWDRFEPFYNSSEFTQMVWKANTAIGCAWQEEECSVQSTDNVGPDPSQPILRWKQLVCHLWPGGNKWDQFGLQVECDDCHVPKQTSTVIIGPQSTSGSEVSSEEHGRTVLESRPKVPFDEEYWNVELNRIEKARHWKREEFYRSCQLSYKSPCHQH